MTAGDAKPLPALPTPVLWYRSDAPVDYEVAVRAMEDHVAAISAGCAGEAVWLLEHPPLYTAGTSARDADLIGTPRFPVFRTGRGGQYTYHGPGQRIAYVMLDLRTRNCDVREFVDKLQNWVIRALARMGITATTRAGRVGVWVPRRDDASGHDDKIAALGIRVRRWISFHGVSINLDPDLSHFDGIVPCGIREHGVTSLAALGVSDDRIAAFDRELRLAFEETFAAATAATAGQLGVADAWKGESQRSAEEAPSSLAATGPS